MGIFLIAETCISPLQNKVIGIGERGSGYEYIPAHFFGHALLTRASEHQRRGVILGLKTAHFQCPSTGKLMDKIGLWLVNQWKITLLLLHLHRDQAILQHRSICCTLMSSELIEGRMRWGRQCLQHWCSNTVKVGIRCSPVLCLNWVNFKLMCLLLLFQFIFCLYYSQEPTGWADMTPRWVSWYAIPFCCRGVLDVRLREGHGCELLS